MGQGKDSSCRRCCASCEQIHIHCKRAKADIAQVHPSNGQGVNTSVEDAAALQVLLANIKDPTDLAKRIIAFEDIRLPRTAIIQILSPLRFGHEKTVAEKLKPYLRGRAPILSPVDRQNFINEYILTLR
jgi:2-polyprenyl-6-methoxyphenol hydroxylase-like FAD-dependent oxidoreductase